MNFFRLFALVWMVGFVGSAKAGPEPPQARFEKALALLQGGRVGDAIPLLEALTHEVPRAGNVFWNLGLAEDTVGAHDKALEAWRAFHRLEPDDWRGQEKLIQALEARGLGAEASRERDDLVARWNAGRDTDLHAQKQFCREIITLPSGPVAVFEAFDPATPPAALLTFAVQSGPRRGLRVTLASDAAAEGKMRSAGRLVEGEHVYVLGLTSQTLQETYRIYRQLPDYATVRKDALAALRGTAKPLSSLSVQTSGTAQP